MAAAAAHKKAGHRREKVQEVGCDCMQDFFQMLRPGLQLLRPPKKDARDGPGIVAGFVAYNSDAFREEFGIEPWQACISLSSKLVSL